MEEILNDISTQIVNACSQSVGLKVKLIKTATYYIYTGQLVER